MGYEQGVPDGGQVLSKSLHGAATPLDLLIARAGGPEAHQGILGRIEEIKTDHRPLPRHYELYDRLAGHKGTLTRRDRRAYELDQHRADLVTKLVPDIASTIMKLETAGNYTVLDDPVHQIVAKENQPGKFSARDIAMRMRNVFMYAWLSKTDREGRYITTVDTEDGKEGFDSRYSVYPLRGKLLDSKGEFIHEKIVGGAQDTFAVFNQNGDMIATFCNTRKANPYGRRPIVELGRTATDYRALPDIRKYNLSQRGVSQLRLLHMLTNPEYQRYEGKPFDYAYSDIRVSGATRFGHDTGEKLELVSNARAVQGVFFGGLNRELPIDLGFGAWGAGWQYVMGDHRDGTGGSGSEPFLRIGRFFDGETYNKALSKRTIWVPDERTGNVVRGFLSSFEGLDVDHLDIRNMDSVEVKGDLDASTEEVVLEPGLETAYTSIDFRNVTREARDTLRHAKRKTKDQKVMTLWGALRAIRKSEHVEAGDAINHTVPYVEAYCECTSPKGSLEDVERMKRSMQALLDHGFTPTGILPSDKVDGGLRITFSLITKAGLDKGLVAPWFTHTGPRVERALATAEGIFGTAAQPGPLETNSAHAAGMSRQDYFRGVPDANSKPRG